jgi:hypothetical protein
MMHAKRCEVFAIGDHTFPASHVCVDGRFRKGQWQGRSSHDDVQRKFHRWVGHLCCGVLVADVGTCAVETHRVQVRWFQNAFIFCSRPFSAALPQSVIAYRAGTEDTGGTPAHSVPITAEQRLLWTAQMRSERRALKTARRAARRVLPVVQCCDGETGAANSDSEPAAAAMQPGLDSEYPACP